MIKLMLLVNRKAGLTPEEFRDYYERVHAPLAAKHVPHLARYVRNYVVDRAGGPLDCDCVTEFWFDLPGPWSEAKAAITPPHLSDMFAEDEERFMDRASMRILVVEEGVTPADQLGGAS